PGLASRREAGRHAADLVGERPRAELESLIEQMTEQMHQAATDLQFELAARLRDEIKELKRELREMKEAGVK
ncbi:UvrB/UvrC motif-containing protein, partial [Spirillospora sp. NPDC049652]